MNYATLKLMAKVAMSATTGSGNPAQAGSRAPLPQVTTIEDWDTFATANFLTEKGFGSYADHFKEKKYNGTVLLNIDSEDLLDMPEQNKLLQKGFFYLITKLKNQK